MDKNIKISLVIFVILVGTALFVSNKKKADELEKRIEEVYEMFQPKKQKEVNFIPEKAKLIKETSKSRTRDIGEKGVIKTSGFYVVEEESVYYRNNKELIGVDVETFQELEDNWAKDKNYVYYNGIKQTYLSPATVKLFPNTYVIDEDGVWIYGTGYYNRVGKVKGADPSTFSVVSHGYAKDKNNIYYFAEKIMDADVLSFASLRGEEYPLTEGLASNWYTKDKNNVYYRSSIMSGVDAQSLVFIGREYAKDKNRVYFRGEVLSDADTNSFALVDFSYAKDKNNIFSNGEILDIEINPDSFSIVGGSFIKDNQHVYFRDHFSRTYGLVSGVDTLTFEKVGACRCVEMSCGVYYKDKNKVFLENEPVDSLDVSSFQYFDSYPLIGGEVPSSSSYSKDKNVVYYGCGKILENADTLTFEGLRDGYAKDKNTVWYFAEIIEGADATTFQSLEKGHAKDKNNTYLYGERVDEAI